MFLLLLIVLLMMAYFILRRSPPKPPLVDSVQTVMPTFIGRLRGQWRGWRSPLATRPESAAHQLQAWAAQNLDETSGLREWLLSLTEPEIVSLAERLHTFCHDLGFELDWLFDPMLRENWALNNAMTAAVTAYCTAVWKTIHVRDDIHAYRAFLAFAQAPEKSDNREFAQRLYTRLIEKGLLPTTPPDIALATDDQRDTYVLTALRQAAQLDNFTFQQTLREVRQGTDGMVFAAS